MRFHVLAVPHTVTDEAYSACAFTQKVLKFCKMMHQRGHEILHYGHERSKVDCTEHITVMTDAILKQTYGDYDWHSEIFKHKTDDICHVYFNAKASEEISVRKKQGDFLLLFWGVGHAGAARAHKDLFIVEPGIGSYNNMIAPFAVFESYAVMHHVYAKFGHYPRFMDAVVPNYFDQKDFLDATKDVDQAVATYLKDKPIGPTMKTILSLPKGSYVVFIGRIIATKGIQTAIEVCRAAGIKLVIAGQGSIQDAVQKDFKVTLNGPEAPNGLTHVGYIEPSERAVLIARAKCIICPTLYAEPFGGVNVEAQMSGIPVITTDWGGFAETVDHGLSGYRCRSMDHFSWALKNVDLLDRTAIRDRAIKNYGFTKVASMYEEYFKMISTVQKRGFYQENVGRLSLKWLDKA